MVFEIPTVLMLWFPCALGNTDFGISTVSLILISYKKSVFVSTMIASSKTGLVCVTHESEIESFYSDQYSYVYFITFCGCNICPTSAFSCDCFSKLLSLRQTSEDYGSPDKNKVSTNIFIRKLFVVEENNCGLIDLFFTIHEKCVGYFKLKIFRIVGFLFFR